MAESRVRASTPWLVRYVVNPIMLRTNGLPILAVRGRRSGKLYRTPVNVMELDGVRYLTSPRGETTWSRNLRAVGECFLKIDGHDHRFVATEVPAAERAPIIAAYLERYGRGTRAQFERLPDPLDHPTFSLEELPS